jgi:hypothetical protein
MKDDILQRAMFAMPLSPQAQNSGILSGFMDEEPMDEEPVSLEDESLEEMPVMARTPQNPEILMNNLRGDMRSVDARYVELAQMVGEQAAMDTPPEVLAMLMGQLGAQQDAAAAPQEPGMGAGIGGLPQGQEMAPPGMMPPETGMQGPSPEMMPQGMGDMGPFPSGGAEQAPPQQFAVGGLAVAGGRIAAPYIVRAGEGIARGAQALNQYLGSRFMAPQFTTQAARSPTGQQLVGQARESLRTLPSGQIVQGTGTQFAPLTTLGQMASPTFTQGVRQGLAPVMNTTAGKLATNIGAGSLVGAGMINAFGPDQKMSEADIRAAGNAMQTDTSGIPGLDAPVMPVVNTESSANTFVPPVAAPLEAPAESSAAAAVEARVDNNAFIKNVAEAAKTRSKADRVRESFDELSPLYKELLGDDDNTRKTQALLLLAEAGFKFAGSTKPTMGMALADAASGIPAGMSALAAQRADRESKVKSAALSQAVEDVNAEDAAQRALQLQVLKGDYEILKKQAEGGGGAVIKDAGAGLRVTETKNGSFVGYSVDPADPTVQRAVTSRYTLTANNPFVTAGGQAPQTPETDKGERIKLTKKVRDLDESLGILENIKSNLTGAYGPGAWYSSFENNMLVPVTPLSPNVTDEAKKTAINQGLNRLMTKIASADTEGRTSVFAQEQVNAILPAKAGTFFQDAEVNAARFNALQALIQNQRQETLAQLGYVTQELTMTAPSTGTKNDPFVLGADEASQQNMLRFLGGTIGKVTDPNALVYIKTPDGTVRPFKASELRNSGGQ